MFRFAGKDTIYNRKDNGGEEAMGRIGLIGQIGRRGGKEKQVLSLSLMSL